MKKLSNNRSLTQAGVGHIALVLVVLVFGVIGFIGYKLYAHPLHKDTSSTVTPVTTGTTSAAPQVKTASDLNKADTVLDQNDPTTTSASDSTYLDAQTSALN
jgi:hypothetical protein